jgi:hypothetical protein
LRWRSLFHFYDVDVYACVEVQKALYVVEIFFLSRGRHLELEIVKLHGEQVVAKIRGEQTCGELKQMTR